MQCQETRWMVADTINLPDKGGMHGCDCNCKSTESIQNFCPVLLLLWLNGFSLGNQIHNSPFLLVCPNNVWPVKQGANFWQKYSRVGAINYKWSTQCEVPKLYTCTTIRGGAKDISMDDACKMRSAHDQPTVVGVVD